MRTTQQVPHRSGGSRGVGREEEDRISPVVPNTGSDGGTDPRRGSCQYLVEMLRRMHRRRSHPKREVLPTRRTPAAEWKAAKPMDVIFAFLLNTGTAPHGMDIVCVGFQIAFCVLWWCWHVTSETLQRRRALANSGTLGSPHIAASGRLLVPRGLPNVKP